MESPIKIDDLGGFPIIFGNTHIQLSSVQNPYDIPWYPDWFLGILTMAYYNPYITG